LTRGAPSGLRKFQPTRSPPRNPKYISVESTIRSAPNRPTLTPSALIRIHGSTQAPQPHSRIHARATSDGGSAARSFPARPHAGTAANPDRRLRRRQVQPALTRNEFSLEFRLPAVPPTRRGEPSVLLPSSLSAAAFHPFVFPPLRCFLTAGLLTGVALAAAAVYRCRAWGRRRICGAACGARSGARLRGS